MATNENTLDRILRAVAGVVAAVSAIAIGAGTVLGIVLVVLAAVLLVTAAVGFCPLYRLLGIRTNAQAVRSGTPR